MPAATPEFLRLSSFLAALVLMGAAESIFPRRPWRAPRAKRWLVHGAIAVFNLLILRLTLAAPLILLAGCIHRRGWGLASLLGLRGASEIIVTLLLSDMMDYWWHRLNHRHPLLWRFHRVHHLDDHVDASTALRFHIGEFILSALAKGLWLLVWGPSVWGFALFEAGISAYAIFHHSNIDFPQRVEALLRWVHMTPRLHASHHTVSLRTRDANFSTIFLAWDRLFGSFQEPDEDELKSLGLPGDNGDLLSPVEIFLAGFRESPAAMRSRFKAEALPRA